MLNDKDKFVVPYDHVNSEIESVVRQAVLRDRSIKRLVNIKETRTSPGSLIVITDNNDARRRRLTTHRRENTMLTVPPRPS